MSTLHQPTDSSDDIVPIMVRMPRTLFNRFDEIAMNERRSRGAQALVMIERDIRNREQAKEPAHAGSAITSNGGST